MCAILSWVQSPHPTKPGLIKLFQEHRATRLRGRAVEATGVCSSRVAGGRRCKAPLGPGKRLSEALARFYANIGQVVCTLVPQK